MAEIGTIDVKVKVSIDRDMAERALKLVEWYVNDTGYHIIAERGQKGDISYRFASDSERSNFFD